MKFLRGTTLFLLSSCSIAANAEDSLLNRDKLLGDVNGIRSTAAQAGVYFDMEYTSVYQANQSDEANGESNYFGRFDFKTAINLSQMGLWENGSVHFQAQAHHGGNTDHGYLASPYIYPNTAGFMGDDFFFSSFYYLHRFERASLLVGKLDAFELLKDGTFYGGAGRYGFMNLAFSAPPSGIIPPAFLGAMVNWKSEDFDWSFILFDPKNRYSDNSISDPFEDGISASLTASHTRKLFGRTSNISLSGTYTTAESQDLENLFNTQEKESGKYNIRIQASHNLYENPNNPAQAWGIYARAAIADGNPNMLNGTFTAGIGGKTLFADRHNDQWGIGYFYNDLSDHLQDSISESPFPKELLDEQGVELYYSYALTPAINITGDVQYIDAMDGSSNLLLGIRTNIRF